jgi:hypothetical protein
MSDSYLMQRTNQILRDKINLGMTGGARCERGTRKRCVAVRRSKTAKKRTGAKRKPAVRRRARRAGCEGDMCSYEGYGMMDGGMMDSGMMMGEGRCKIGTRKKCMPYRKKTTKRRTTRKRASGEGIMAGEGRCAIGTRKRCVAVRRSKTSKKKTGRHGTSEWITFLKHMMRKTGREYGDLMQDRHVQAMYHKR